MRFTFPARALLTLPFLIIAGKALPGYTAPAAPRPLAAQAPQTVDGKLVIGAQGALHVTIASGEVVITSSEASILHTLQDPRMNGREVRLQGTEGTSPGSAKSLNVAHVLTVHDGKTFRLRFYCHVCNIPATEPGPCVCCQRWTDIEEIPTDQVTDDMVLVP